MRRVLPLTKYLRRARFETFEERLALSAQPISNFDPLGPIDRGIEHHYGEVSPLPVAGTPDFVLEHLERSDLNGLASPLGAADAWTGLNRVRDTYGLSGLGQTVAIIDSGIAYDHRALGSGFGSQYRVVGGWDFAENDANPYDDGPAGFHGTHVAGIVGSSDATYRGVASGVDLVALRVFDDRGSGNFSWVEQALQWVHDHRNDFENPITTVNLSLGTAWNADSPPSWAMLEDEFAQLKKDGIVVAVSAGNSFSSYNSAGLSYPAASSFVIPVSSVDNNGQFSSFSQRNARVIAAPGRSIVSTVPDYVTGSDGVANDFATASGTSMAAPYLAGASALVRQAMQIVGISNVTQDTIYNHLRNTADTFYDSVTNASYSRLNVGAAIDALIPADDYGGPSDAYHLGTLQNSRTISGFVGTLSDLDSFSFTAAASGTARFQVDTHFELVAELSRLNGTAQVDEDQLSFQVVAGQQYTVSLGTRAGIGTYTATLAIESQQSPSATDLGVIESLRLAAQDVAGEKVYQLRASRQGLLTVEASYSFAAGDVNLELYDSNRQLVAASRLQGNADRLDVWVGAGQDFTLRVTGNNANVYLQANNLVTIQGSTAVIYGTSAADSFHFSTQAEHHVNVNGVSYLFSKAATQRLNFVGSGGHDTVRVEGTSANEQATLRATSLAFKSATFEVNATDVESMTVLAGTGRDIVYLYDSAGDDRLEARPTTVRLRADNGSFSQIAEGFDYVYAYAQAGNDRATFYDSSGNDRFDGAPTYALMQATGSFYNYAQGFDSCAAYASTGYDTAYFHDSKGNDQFVGSSTAGRMTDSAGTFSNYGEGFDAIQTYFRNGGKDTKSYVNAYSYRPASHTEMVGILVAAPSSNATVQDTSADRDGGTERDAATAANRAEETPPTAVETNGATTARRTRLRGIDNLSATVIGRTDVSSDLEAVDQVFQRLGRGSSSSGLSR